MPTLPWTTLLVRLAVATVLGVLIGLERERLDRAAGLRTHTLVAVASALLMLVSGYSFPELAAPRDPTRLAAQVVSGIGFLGAGVIIFRKNTVRGLTTAASVWAVSGVGLAAGGGLYVAAVVATAFILLVQGGLRPLERRIFARPQEHRLELRVRRGDHRLAAVERAVATAQVELRGLRLRPARDGAEDRVDLNLGTARSGALIALLEALQGLDGVRVVDYTLAAPRPAAFDATDDDEPARLPGDDAPAEDSAEDAARRY